MDFPFYGLFLQFHTPPPIWLRTLQCRLPSRIKVTRRHQRTTDFLSRFLGSFSLCEHLSFLRAPYLSVIWGDELIWTAPFLILQNLARRPYLLGVEGRESYLDCLGHYSPESPCSVVNVDKRSMNQKISWHLNAVPDLNVVGQRLFNRPSLSSNSV